MFTHLHLHTEYSLLDGACRIEPLLDKVEQLGMDSCAITDHGVMYGVVDFYRAAKARGIHPVIGCEVYVCNDMRDKQSREYSHLILLCENQVGYQNLIQMVSQSYVEGFYYKPRIDYDLLAKHAQGLIGLSACLSGDLPKMLLDGRENDARKMAQRYLEIFGEGNFYVEIQDHALPDEKRVLPRLIKLAREMNIPLAATNDVHYLSREDAYVQEVQICINTGKTLDDPDRMQMETQELYLKSEEEMRVLFGNIPEALENTHKIAMRCKVDFDFSSIHLPKYRLPEGQNPAQTLRDLCYKGLYERYGQTCPQAQERLEYELNTIESMGYVDYFLIVWDFIKYARDNGILVGPGRGSGAGSIVAYSLGITSIDPLKYNLVFERFLNPERISMPDLDIDFDYERRGEVIDYVARKYGHDHVAQIITFGTMAARGAIRDVGRVMGISYQEVDQVAKMVPFELNMTLEKALKQSAELRRSYEENETIKTLIDTARALEGMPRHASTHAAGVLITDEPVAHYVPLQTNDDVITTQFPMGTLESLGLLKMDFLGLRTLTVISDTLAMVREGDGPQITPEEIPMDDPKVYAMISDGDTDGVFQLEGSGMRNFLTNMRPENFEDIIAAVSLYRPGPMESIPRYVAGKHDPSSVKYLDPSLEPILNVTYGCMVYQEQVMQIVRDMAGYSMGRSDLVRRAMSKKKHDVMQKEKENFVHGLIEDGEIVVPGAVRNGVPEQAAYQIFDEMTSFASYAFNKSHAAAYGVVAVQTAYLKLYYPVEFMAALMNSFTGNTDKVAYYIQYCRKKGIDVLNPDVNLSQHKFSVDRTGDKPAIRFGLSAVKNVGGNAVDAITAEVEAGGPFRDLYDFCARISTDAVNKRAVECLIKAGAFDGLEGNRAQKLAVYERALDGAAKTRKSRVEGQMSLFGEESQVEVPPPPLPQIEDFNTRVKLGMEKEMTGVYITGHPLDEFMEELQRLDISSQWVNSLGEDRPNHGIAFDGLSVQMGGMIAEKRTRVTRNGGMMAFVMLEDLYGSIEALVFPRVYEKWSTQLTEEALVVLSGRLSIREDEPPKLLLESVAPLVKGFIPNRKLNNGGGRPSNGYFADRSDEPLVAVETNDKLPTKKLYLKLRDESQRAQIMEILVKTPGRIPVTLYIEEEQKAYLVPANAYVNDHFDKIGLLRALGEGRVVLKEVPPKP